MLVDPIAPEKLIISIHRNTNTISLIRMLLVSTVLTMDILFATAFILILAKLTLTTAPVHACTLIIVLPVLLLCSILISVLSNVVILLKLIVAIPGAPATTASCTGTVIVAVLLCTSPITSTAAAAKMSRLGECIGTKVIWILHIRLRYNM